MPPRRQRPAREERLRCDVANRNQAPEIIMFVRHGEKPGEGSRPHGVNHHGEIDEHSLSVQGWTRAGALAGLFAHAPPSPIPMSCDRAEYSQPGRPTKRRASGRCTPRSRQPNA